MHKIGIIVLNNPKRARVSTAKSLASKYKCKQTSSLSSKESKLGSLSTKISNTNFLLEHSSSFRLTSTLKE